MAAALGYSADRLQLTSLAYTKGAQKLLDLAYGYGSGNNGQIQNITDNTGTQEMGRSTTYTYDALHRLKTAVTSGSASYPQWGLQWSYDRYGNRLSQSATAGNPPAGSWSYADPGGAQTNRPDGYAHDANGNMSNDGANALTYDAADRLVSSTGGSASGTYTYDAAGVRVKKVSAGTTTVYIYSGTKVIAEYVNGAAPASPTREQLYADGQWVMTDHVVAGIKEYRHHDHLNVRVRLRFARTPVVAFPTQTVGTVPGSTSIPRFRRSRSFVLETRVTHT